MPEKENPKELDELRQQGMHDRENTQLERKKIEQRRQEIEQRRQTLSLSSDGAAFKELLDLQLEIIGLQEHIVELQLTSEHQREAFVALKKRANGIWHELSMYAEESQLRREAVQQFSEAIQKLHEDVQKLGEDYEEHRRAKQR